MNNRTITSWLDISITEYLTIQDILSNKELDDITKLTKIASILYNTDISTMPILEATEVIQNLTDVLSKKIEDVTIKDKYTVDDTTFIVTNPQAMTFAQYQDYIELSKTGSDRNILDLLAVILVPKGNVYNTGYDLTEAKSLIGKLPVVISPQILANFQKQSEKYLIRSLSSLTAKILLTGMKWKQKKALIQMIWSLAKLQRII